MPDDEGNLPEKLDESNDPDERPEDIEDPGILIPKSVLQQLPKDVRIKVTQSGSSYRFSGPMPHPDLYEKYEEVLPGSADRLLTLTEKQAEHRTNWEIKALDASIKHADRGQFFGLIVALAAIGGAIYLGSQGQNIVGGFLVLASVIGILERIVKMIAGKDED